MTRFIVEVRVALPIDAPTPEAAERIASAEVAAALKTLRAAGVAGARAVEQAARRDAI